jgi:hypothetical protein
VAIGRNGALVILGVCVMSERNQVVSARRDERGFVRARKASVAVQEGWTRDARVGAMFDRGILDSDARDLGDMLGARDGGAESVRWYVS